MLLRFDVTGEARRFHYNAGAELLWRNLGATYEARQEIRPSCWARARRPAPAASPHGACSRCASATAPGPSRPRISTTTPLATFSANTPDSPIGPDAQDRLSVFIQLGALLAAAPERYPPGTRITLTVVGARSADRWASPSKARKPWTCPPAPRPR